MMGRVNESPFMKCFSLVRFARLKAYLCFALLLCMVLLPSSGHAFEGGVEKDLQTGLEQSRTIILCIQNKLQSGSSLDSEITRLKTMTENIRASHILLEERFKLREEKVKTLGSKAVERHQVMAEGYKKALTEYLNLVDSLPAASSQESVDRSQEKINKLKTILDNLLPKKKRPIFGSLPYKHLNYPAQEPSTAPTITPAYRGGNQNSTSDDLKSTSEAPISMEIANLAKSLNWSPVLIYEYVKNNIETEWYWGCMKGAEETLHQKSGNDCDHAALLVALLRAANYPTRYVRGTIEFFANDGKPLERAKNLTNIDDPAKIAEFFQKAGIPYKTVLDGTTIKNFQIEHLWVETFAPYSNYRGAVMDDQGKIWLGLDTSIKASDYIYNTASDIMSEYSLTAVRDDYLSAIRTQTPLEYLRKKINDYLIISHPTKTYNDYLTTKTLVPDVMQILPSSMQFNQIRVTNEYTEIPAELRHKVSFIASDMASKQLFSATFDTLTLSNKTISIGYDPETVEDQGIIDSYGGLANTPAYLVRLRPVLNVNRDRLAIGQDGLPMGSEYELTIELTGAFGVQSSETVTNTHVMGNFSVIGIIAQNAVATPSPLEGEGGGEGGKDAERLLNNSAQHYIDRWNKAEDELASLLHLTITRPLPTIVTLGGVIDVTYLFGAPHGFTWKGEFIDADLRSIEAVPSSGSTNDSLRVKTFVQLSSLQGSVLEHKIFEDDLQVSSISTAKLLQLANTQPATPIVTIDQSNIATKLPTLSFDQNIKDDIIASVNQNFTVRIPQSELTYLDWTGIGYLKENLQTAESGWMLTGMIAGGMTAQSPDEWNLTYIETVLGNPYYEDSRNVYITSPTNESTINTSAVVVTGVVLDPEATVTVNGVSADREGATFRAVVKLTSGSNTIIAVATNKAGRSTFDIIAIRYKILLALAVTYPFDKVELSVSPIYVEGIVSDPSATVTVNSIRGTVSSDGRFIANGAALSEGQNQITAAAMNSDGDIASQTITLNYHAVQPQPTLTLSITSPASGATINKPATTVAGTVTSAASEIWITVNNMPATLSGNQFSVNNVPLINGINRIIVNAMDSNGAMARQEISVTADTSAPYVQLNANITSGIAPLTTYFTLSTSLTYTIASYQMDYKGDGTIDYTGATFDNISNVYTTEGVYHPKVTVTDSQGTVYSDTITVVVLNKAWFEAFLTQKWNGMKAALAAGNIESAVAYFSPLSKERYREIFTALSATLPQLAQNMQEIQLIYARDNITQYRIRKNELYGSQMMTLTYYIYFVRNPNGMWTIDKF